MDLPLLLAGAYLLGGIPFGLLVARARGVDIRRHGSGNVGATNVGRALGRKWGILVFLLDAGKGAASTLAAGCLFHWRHGAEPAKAILLDWWWLGAGLACVLGSIAPIYLRFRGGKGVATSVGAILGIHPYLTWPALALLLVWAGVVRVSGYISLGSITAAICMAPSFLGCCVLFGWRASDHYPLLGLSLAMTFVVLARHRENIGRLLAGTESRIGERRSGSTPEEAAVPRFSEPPGSVRKTNAP